MKYYWSDTLKTVSKKELEEYNTKNSKNSGRHLVREDNLNLYKKLLQKEDKLKFRKD